MTDLEFAEHLARRAHAAQKDRFTGAPYVEHLARVAAMVEGDEAKTIAWLHDIIEDTPFTLEALRALFPARIVRAVALLTRHPGYETYEQYIRTLAQSWDDFAITVKFADLHDHLRADGPVIPAAMRARYTAAWRTLEPLHDAYLTRYSAPQEGHCG